MDWARVMYVLQWLWKQSPDMVAPAPLWSTVSGFQTKSSYWLIVLSAWDRRLFAVFDWLNTFHDIKAQNQRLGIFRSEDEDACEYEFSVLSMRIRFGGRHFSKSACSERKTRTCPPI